MQTHGQYRYLYSTPVEYSTDTDIQQLKRQWLALDQENDKRGKIALLRSLDVHGPEMEALCDFISSLHFTQETAMASCMALVVRR